MVKSLNIPDVGIFLSKGEQLLNNGISLEKHFVIFK